MLRSCFLALLSLIVSLGLCELAARVLLAPSLSDRVEIVDGEGGRQADCYPRVRGVKMMYDLGQRDELMSFVHLFHVTKIAWPGNPAEQTLQAPPEQESTLLEALERLRAQAPLCMAYDTTDTSPRFLSAPARFRHSLALLGDSFTFGQGVRDAETLPANLARRTHWRVRSYARPGANIPQIEEQFERAMKERASFHFERIVYVYVPNDPEVTDEIAGRSNLINDLMNQRIGATPYSSRLEVRFLGRVAVHSALAAALLRAYSARVVAARTLRFYADANDPARNVGFLSTFEKIRTMRDRAVAAGVDFVLVGYPMMLDFDHYPLESINRHLAEATAYAHVDFLDLLVAFHQAPHGNLTVHPIDYHPNAAACVIAADAIAAFLAGRSVPHGERRLSERGGVVPHVARPRAR